MRALLKCANIMDLQLLDTKEVIALEEALVVLFFILTYKCLLFIYGRAGTYKTDVVVAFCVSPFVMFLCSPTFISI